MVCVVWGGVCGVGWCGVVVCVVCVMVHVNTHNDQVHEYKPDNRRWEDGADHTACRG